MYEEFYGLKERPFTLVPDPDYLFLGSQHKLARAYLEYGIKERMGFVVLTGEIGTGKTTLIKSLLREKEAGLRLGVLYQTSVEAEDLLDLLLKEFEIRGNFGSSRAARLGGLNQFLETSYARGEHVVLVVDEAQNLGPKALEELRLLSNLQTDKEPLLQVILVGQPGLRERLRHPTLRQLAQRVTIHYHLRPLDHDETKEYIRFRLARAGGRDIFTTSALDKIFDYTHGVPRRINTWCDLALVAGFAEDRHEIDGEFIDLVIAAQGGSLEDTEATEPFISEDLVTSADHPPSSMPASHDGLASAVRDLSARLTRLEGLVLEMTSQLVPALQNILTSPFSQGLHPENQEIPMAAPIEPVGSSVSQDYIRNLRQAFDDLLETPSSQVAPPTEDKTAPMEPIEPKELAIAPNAPKKRKKVSTKSLKALSSQVAPPAKQKTAPVEPLVPDKLSITKKSPRKRKKALDKGSEGPSSQVLPPTEQQTASDEPREPVELPISEAPPRKRKRWWNKVF